MADSNQLDASNAPQWDEDLIYLLISHPVRRRLLYLLAANKPMVAADLAKEAGCKLDDARKHLEKMLRAGLVTMPSRDYRDGRRALYTLNPSLPIVTTASGKGIEFGFCLFPL